jgi:hypothetical protein
MAKIENQRLRKNCKKLSIEDKCTAIGWRQENVINCEIGPCRGCGVDGIYRLFTYSI